MNISVKKTLSLQVKLNKQDENKSWNKWFW